MAGLISGSRWIVTSWKTLCWRVTHRRRQGGTSVKRWVKHLLGFFQSEMGWVLIGLFESLLAGLEGILLRKRIRTVLKCLGGCKGIRFGRFLKSNLAGCPKGVSVGFSLKPKDSGCLKFHCKAQLKNQDGSFEGRELLSIVPKSPLPDVIPESPSSPVFECRLGSLDPLLVRTFSKGIGTAVDGFKSERNASGLGSSSEAALLKSMSIQNFDTVSTPNSVSLAMAFLPASSLCSEWEVSLIGAADSKTEEAKIDRIPSPAKGLNRRGFFGPRVMSPSTSVVKEAFISSQSFKDDSSLGAVELCRVKEASLVRVVESLSVSPVKADKNPTLAKGLIRWGSLGSNSVFPSLSVLSSFPGSKVNIVESLVCSTASTSSLGAVELGKSLSQPFPHMLEGGTPFYSFVSKSQLGHSRRVKEKVAKQLHKN
jgi:hypothetical protein